MMKHQDHGRHGGRNFHQVAASGRIAKRVGHVEATALCGQLQLDESAWRFQLAQHLASSSGRLVRGHVFVSLESSDRDPVNTQGCVQIHYDDTSYKAASRSG